MQNINLINSLIKYLHNTIITLLCLIFVYPPFFLPTYYFIPSIIKNLIMPLCILNDHQNPQGSSLLHLKQHRPPKQNQRKPPLV